MKAAIRILRFVQSVFGSARAKVPAPTGRDSISAASSKRAPQVPAPRREVLPVRSEIRDGGQTRALDLKGRGERVIDRIEMTYRAKPNFKGSAKVCVMGLT